MACAANYAWVNRSSMTFLCRQAFAKLFKQSPDDLDMNIIYDVSHNIAKVHHVCCSRWQGMSASTEPSIQVVVSLQQAHVAYLLLLILQHPHPDQ